MGRLQANKNPPLGDWPVVTEKPSEAISGILREQMAAKGLTYIELGRHLGISARRAKKLLSQPDMSLKTLSDVSVVLGLSLNISLDR